MMKLTFLGTGTSCGVPTIGCQCEVCRSRDTHDRRLRCSALLETEHTRILIDCGPDFREQILPQPFRQIDAVLITHAHYDHMGGIDDLRPYCQFGEINIYADAVARKNMLDMLPYCFATNRYPGVPAIQLHTLHKHVPLTVNELKVVPVEVMHGRLPILGFRIGSLAYITDMKTIADEEMAYLEGLDVLVVNALRVKEYHHSHQRLEEAVEFAKRVGAHRTFFVHMSHDIGLHEKVNQQLPENMQLAFDGQEITVV